MSEAVPKARQFYDRISHLYDSLADSNEHAAREKGLALLDIQPGERVLEIGYGTGHSLQQFAESVGATGRVFGVDISQGMCDVAQKRITAADVADRVELGVAEVPPLPYDDDSVDVVSMSFTLELFGLDVIPTVLQETIRVLKSGGRVGVVSMAVTPEGQRDSALEKTYKWMHHHFPHIVDCQPIDAVAFFEQAGLEISARTDLEIWTMPVVALVSKTK
jgi:demethylmenaquinone methyltransferase/2-methoxy-6-polyprenyl-1,4-benzoquinol methylase